MTLRQSAHAASGGVKYVFNHALGDKANRLLTGIDYDRQDDDRRRFDNLSGVVGPLALEQNELVTSLGIYAQNETRLSDRVELTPGLRYDEIEFDVDDDFLADRDDSGKVTLDQISPMIGVSIAGNKDTHRYATVSSAFETPTTTEFANPGGGGGFIPDLEPQESINYEIGIKTRTPRYRFEAALFHIEVDNELTPFELPPPLDGRTYFGNAGSSTRDGLEVSYSRELTRQIGFVAAYTGSDFVFDRFTDADGAVFDGKQIPGIREDLTNLELSWFGESGFYANWDMTRTGSK